MAQPWSADDLIPLVQGLSPQERARFLRLLTLSLDRDAAAYRAVPPADDEFSSEDEPLAWDADGWDGVG
jgi:hypothetical protein